MGLQFWQSCRFPFLESVIISSSVSGNDPSPAFKILVQTFVKTSIMVSQPAWTSSACILSTSADFCCFSLQSQFPHGGLVLHLLWGLTIRRSSVKFCAILWKGPSTFAKHAKSSLISKVCHAALWGIVNRKYNINANLDLTAEHL